MSDFKQDLSNELKNIQEDTVLSPEYRRQRLIMYLIRTSISVVLFYLFWEYLWVRWALWLYIPLNLMSLFSIFGWTYFLRKKISETQQQIDDLDDYEDE
ncbi:hypothetical protein [uncultured Psychroserpens sp.]|uniref:hypothetical protein n=1 Tax=uncultured Psychroserpens sp. TaxID=255436 RepID=UPI00260448A7|nr:hypothetical protein [uncultured Psychroserpens sp.]